MSDNSAYLREWANEIRNNSGASMDANKLDSIATELDRLRKDNAELRDALGNAELQDDRLRAELEAARIGRIQFASARATRKR